MRVTFSSTTAARAAVKVLESYGYPAEVNGTEVQTCCPTLLAIPAIEKRVGLGQVQRLDLAAAPALASGAGGCEDALGRGGARGRGRSRAHDGGGRGEGAPAGRGGGWPRGGWPRGTRREGVGKNMGGGLRAGRRRRGVSCRERG